MRYGIFVHDPDGDMGYGEIVGAFKTGEAADYKAETIRREALRRGRDIETVIVPLQGGATSARDIVKRVFP